METIKIECACGQHYAFDVEPVNGRMGCSVACPACGADGTSAANAILSEKLGQAMPPPPPPRLVVPPSPAPPAGRSTGGGLKISASQHTAAPARITANASQLGLVDKEQAKHEARAKISWGNSRESVIHYLMVQGFEQDEATELVKGFYRERVAGVRANGFKQFFFGLSLMVVPLTVGIVYFRMKVMPMTLTGMGVGALLFGCYKILNGLILIIAPRVQQGDVTAQ